MLRDQVLLHIARSFDFPGEKCALFRRLPLLAKKEPEQGGQNERGGKRAHLEQLDTHAGEKTGHGKDLCVRALDDEPDKIGQPQSMHKAASGRIRREMPAYGRKARNGARESAMCTTSEMGRLTFAFSGAIHEERWLPRITPIAVGR